MADTATIPSTNLVSKINLQKEIDLAQALRPWPSGIFSKTLVKHDDMRVVLTLMDADALMKEHHADCSVAIQVLLGKLQVTSQETGYQLHARSLMALPPAVPHQVLAIEASAFLLTLSWPDSEKLRSIPHRGYGS